MKLDLKIEVEIPQGVNVTIENGLLKIEGPAGSIERNLRYPGIEISKEENKIKIFAKDATKTEKMLIGTFKAHIKNMLNGENEAYVYKLKICSSHFPMNVKLNGDKIVVKNFLGEVHPRTTKIKPNVDVKVNGDEIVVSSPNIELAGQVAADIENSTKITNRDRRIFQDGIFITEKKGKV